MGMGYETGGLGKQGIGGIGKRDCGYGEGRSRDWGCGKA